MDANLKNRKTTRSQKKSTPTFFTEQDLKRRKREGVIIIAVLAVIALLTFTESKLFHFGSDIPIWNTILMFILININLLLVIRPKAEGDGGKTPNPIGGGVHRINPVAGIRAFYFLHKLYLHQYRILV